MMILGFGLSVTNMVVSGFGLTVTNMVVLGFGLSVTDMAVRIGLHINKCIKIRLGRAMHHL